MIWAVMILTGIANFSMRFIMFSGLTQKTLPPVIDRLLKFVPTAVLSAIIAASVFYDATASEITVFNLKVLAAVIAAIAALITRSVLVTIFLGLAVLWSLSGVEPIAQMF